MGANPLSPKELRATANAAIAVIDELVSAHLPKGSADSNLNDEQQENAEDATERLDSIVKALNNDTSDCKHEYIVRDKDDYQFYTSSFCIHCKQPNPDLNANPEKKPETLYCIESRDCHSEEWEPFDDSFNPLDLLKSFVASVSAEEVDDVNRYWRVREERSED